MPNNVIITSICDGVNSWIESIAHFCITINKSGFDDGEWCTKYPVTDADDCVL